MAAIEVQQYGERLLQVYGDAIRRLRSRSARFRAPSVSRLLNADCSPVSISPHLLLTLLDGPVLTYLTTTNTSDENCTNDEAHQDDPLRRFLARTLCQ
jgi:hypothetical protein